MEEGAGQEVFLPVLMFCFTAREVMEEENENEWCCVVIMKLRQYMMRERRRRVGGKGRSRLGYFCGRRARS